MRATNHQRGARAYQGYPYVSPPVHDAPSVDAATASRWNNLPRKQLESPVHRAEPALISKPGEINIQMQRIEPAMISSPEGADSERALPAKPDPGPQVYIDMPETSGSHVSTERRESSTDEESESTFSRDKRKSADDPVVYIDLPDTNGSDVAQYSINEDRREEPEYVQDTIFFNPFENRRMEMHKDDSIRESESDNESIVSSHTSRRPLPPIRPTTLDLNGAGSSAASSSNHATGSTPGRSTFMSKETMLYGQDDGFPLSPIPVSEFPEPPPAYTDIDRVSSPVVETPEPVVEQPRREEPPRTQVILPGDPVPTTPIGIPNPDRKYLNCHHCGMRVHSLVVKENGTMTHVIAVLCGIICMLPCVLFIYCTDVFKTKNHYCPNCNKIIGYELPCSSSKIMYVN